MTQSEEQFAVALQNLREDLKEHRLETRQDIKDLEKKTDEWHDEVRKDFTDVKKRLTTIETQISTKSDEKKFSTERMASWGAIGLVVLGMIQFYYKIETAHKETLAQVEANRELVEHNHEETVQKIERQN
jgi:phage shock protein A